MKNRMRATGRKAPYVPALVTALMGLALLTGSAAAQSPPPIRINTQGPSAMELCLYGLNSWDRTYLTARSKGMGGVVLGLGGNASSGSQNPAALSTLPAPELSSESRMKGGSASGLTVPEFIVGDDGSLIEVSEYAPGITGNYSYNDLSFAMPILLLNRRAGIGVGYHRTHDFKSGEETRMKIKAPLGEADLGQGYDFSGGVNSLSPSMGWQVTSRLSLGATLNFMSGTITENGNQGVTVFGFVAARGALLFEQDISGTSLDLGAQYRPNEKLTLGVSLQPGHSLSFRDGYYSYQPLPTEQSSTPQIFIIERPLLDYKLSVPTQWGLGGTYKMLNGRLLLAADYWNRPWSGSTYTRKDFYVQPIFSDTTNYAQVNGVYVVSDSEVKKNSSFVDTSHLRLGFEYQLKKETTPGSVQIPIRFGYRREPLTLANTNPDSFNAIVDSFAAINADPTLSDIEKQQQIGAAQNLLLTEGYNLIATDDAVDATTVSVGSGISVGAFGFDVAYSRTSFTLDRLFLGSFSDLTVNPRPQNVREKHSHTEFSFSASLSF